MTNRSPSIGDEVRCMISGFQGIVTTHARHLSGCDRLWVQPRVGDDGKHPDGLWVDIDMLKIVRPHVIDPVVYDRRAPGGVDLPPSRS